MAAIQESVAKQSAAVRPVQWPLMGRYWQHRATMQINKEDSIQSPSTGAGAGAKVTLFPLHVVGRE